MTYFDWAMRGVPEHTQRSLEDYFCRCLPPGGFIKAVLVGDLFAAACSADYENANCLADIAEWVYQNAPAGSFGSNAAIKGWLSKNQYQQMFEKEMLVNILKDEYHG